MSRNGYKLAIKSDLQQFVRKGIKKALIYVFRTARLTNNPVYSNTAAVKQGLIYPANCTTINWLDKNYRLV
ncbi:MAG: hypothetical protein FWD40_07425 [Treponema sp.]|nr:hypothetical protein [Treponema sp.]